MQNQKGSEKGEVKVEVKEIRMTQVSATGAWGWARLRYQVPENFVSIQSDYGNWSYGGWQSIGTKPLPIFLAHLHAGYMGGKMLGGEIDVFSATKTQQGIRELLIECRCAGVITRGQARKEWDLCEMIEDSFSMNEWIQETGLDDAWDWAFRTTMNASWRNFWDRLWVPYIQPELRKLGEKAA